MPDGTLVTGHRRWRAFQLLGQEMIPVKVHHNLAGKGAAVEALLIEDNMTHRRLSKLTLARCIVELEKAKKGTQGAVPRGELAKRVGKMIGKSGRTVDRYLLSAENAARGAASF